MIKYWLLWLCLLLACPFLAAAQNITSNLVARYAFATNSGADSQGTANGTLGSAGAAPTFVTGPCVTGQAGLGGCMSFDGDDNISLPNVAALNLTGTPLTLAAWINTADSTAPGAHIIGGYQSGGAFAGYALGYEDPGVLRFWNGAAWTLGSAAVTSGTWRHVAVTHTGTTATFYIDGVVDVVRTGVATPTSFAGLRMLGADTASGNTVIGSLDEIRFYNRALTGPDILALFQFTGAVAGVRKPRSVLVY